MSMKDQKSVLPEQLGIDLKYNLMNHKDTIYIKEQSGVLSLALSECYEAQPEDPIEYIANYLLNYNKTKVNQAKFLEKFEDRERLSRKLAEEKEELEKEERNQEKSQEAYQNLEKEFFERIKTAEDSTELINEMCTHISTFVGATGTYIYENKPKCRLSNNTDKMEESIVSEGMELRVIATDDDHTFMFEKKLEIDTSVTGLFYAEEFVEYESNPNRDQQENKDEEVEEDENNAAKKALVYYDEEDLELQDLVTVSDNDDKMNSIFVPQVICDPKLQYFRVPKLGCYYAVCFEMNSCLSIESLEAAFVNLQDITRIKASNDELRQKYEENLKTWQELKTGEKPETPEYEEEALASYEKKTRKCVLVIDSLGQDRIFTAAQREYVRRIIRVFKDYYEKSEESHLNECCDILVQQTDQNLLREFEQDLKINHDKTVAELNADLPYDPEYKESFYIYYSIRDTLLDEKYWTMFTDMKAMKIFKYQQIITSIFYIYLGLTKEEINIKDPIYGVSNNLEWVTHRRWLENRLFEAIKAYNPRGPRPDAVQSYRRLQVLEEQLQEMTEETVTRFSWILDKFRLMLLNLILCRRYDAEHRQKLRNQQIEEIQKIQEEYEEFQRRKEAVEEQGEEFLETFDKEIPETPEEEFDMDLQEIERE